MTRRRKRDYASTLPRPLPAEVARTALLERITHADDANLVVLVAPSGYGKTTFLGQLARNSRHPAWLTLSERHTEFKTLSDDLMASITRVAEEATFERVRKAVAEGAQVGALATSFARELDELTLNLRIFVDQTNLLSNDALSWLESLALALGEGHQLVYCAYDLASERLAAPLASGKALLLSASDLAFSEDETRAYLSERGSSADVHKVQRDLEGWPAGVGLVAAGVEHILSHDDLLVAAFDRLPEEVRKALPEASVMEVWREADARRLGCDLPEGWLREARRAGLPMTPLGAQAYRPHTLVVEMLDRELQAQSERYKQLHNQAAYEAQGRGDFLIAFRHYQCADQAQEAIQIAEILVPNLLESSEFFLICQLLEQFDRCHLSPALTSKYGYALLMSGNLSDAENLLNQPYVKNLGDDLTFRSLARIFSHRGEVAKGLELIEEGLALTRGSIGSGVRSRLELEKIGLLTDVGRLDDALKLALYWVIQVERRGDRKNLADILTLLADIYRRLNDNEAYEKMLLRALAILKDLHQLNVFNAFRLFAHLVHLYRVQNRLAEALNIVNRTLPVARQENSVWVSYLLAVQADTLTNQTAFAEAALRYREAAEFFEHSSPVNAQLALYKLSDVARRGGEQTLVQRTLAKARQLSDSDDVFTRGWRDFYEALESLSKGNLLVARQQLRAAGVATESELRLRVCAYFLEIDRQEEKLNKEQVAALVEQLDAFGHDATLWIDAEPLKPLYEELVTRGWYAERFAPFTNPRPSDTLQRSQPALIVQTLGEVHLSLDGNPVKVPFSKAAELLVWLALHGPVTREQIINALWDGSNDSKHVEYGKLALRRLRTALAEHVPFNPLVYMGRQYRLADELEVKLDVQELLKAFEAGDDTVRREALERYSGTFLPGVTSEWAESLRTKLHDAAVATAMGLGALYERSDLNLALWAYRKLVELEPLFLDGHCALIQLLQASGNQVGARLAYQTYLRVLTTEYGETPDLSFDDLLHKTQNKYLN